MTSAEIRQSFLEFFRHRGHTIVPSSSLLPDSPNLLFTNAGMNQFVPIFLGQTPSPYSPGRAADTQKCIRAGGKHNDLEDVGLDTYHHTFFEMLGNWSFGDYFKQEAIAWAWELLTGEWGFPKERLYATVYKPDPQAGDPSTFDSEAHETWSSLFRSAGLDPARHVVMGNRKDNFWMMGETGPCGPCSELHVDLTPGGDSGGKLVNAGSPSCIEIWNLVFIQFNANPDGTFSPLPARHVDTGMGFERVASILQCTDGFRRFDRTISNYETDVFRPLFDCLESLSGLRYRSTLPPSGRSPEGEQEAVDVAFRVIADHIRTLAFAIADGISPGNTDRHYVLRRILRRAVRYGRHLGFRDPFFYKLVDVLVSHMGSVFPEIRARQNHVREVIRREEESFNRTLDRGIEIFTEEVDRAQGRELSGEFAFRLYDTFGFPLDLTELMARERGLSVDTATFEELMGEQRQRARAAQKREAIELSQIGTDHPTLFVGFEEEVCASTVLELVTVQGKTAAILDRSPCYAEMGGQVGDSGLLTLADQSWRVVETRKSGPTWLHFLEGEEAPEVGSTVTAQVGLERRRAIERHHTATHLLHWALHEVLGPEVSQKGSYVGPEKLTFDFNSQALDPSQIEAIEALVNQRVLENHPVSWREVPYSSVKGRADVMQFFGDKYGDQVRVVQIGGVPSELNGFSMELCGGTHVRATGQVGLFWIVSDTAIAAGVRRIEAVAGLAAHALLRGRDALLVSACRRLRCDPGQLGDRLETAFEQRQGLERELKAMRQREASTRSARLLDQALKVGPLKVVAASVEAGDAQALRELAIGVTETMGEGVVVLGSSIEGRAMLVSLATPQAQSMGFRAGEIVRTLCQQIGGKGGGKPDFAMGGGPDSTNLPRVLESWLAEAKSRSHE